MKCKNCDHVGKYFFLHDPYNSEYSYSCLKDCRCDNAEPKVECKHLDLLPYRLHGGATVHQNWRDSGWNDGLKCLKERCKFCPFCGDELK